MVLVHGHMHSTIKRGPYCSQGLTVYSGQVLWQAPSKTLAPSCPGQCFKVGMSTPLPDEDQGSARQRACPGARPQGKEAGPQNRSLSLPHSALASLCAQGFPRKKNHKTEATWTGHT